jgi:tetratricopeptide (TPR) repeat protein
MNALDPCPDDLLARAANAPLAPAERDLLAVHLARCETCRTAADVTAALAAEPSVLRGDEFLIARLAERAAGSGGGIPLRRRRPLHVAVAAVATAAAVAGLWHFARGRRAEPPRTAEHAPAEPARAAEPPRTALPQIAAEPALSPKTTPSGVETGPGDPTARTPRTSAPKPARGASPTVDIDRLLSDARAARARGEHARARALYARVARLAPGTPAAAVADVAIGLMLVERAGGGDARAALEAFDRYLAVAPGGALREEAIAGRARSLERLGERARAISAWQDVLAQYPHSPQAPLARRRLDALRAGAASQGSEPR